MRFYATPDDAMRWVDPGSIREAGKHEIVLFCLPWIPVAVIADCTQKGGLGFLFDSCDSHEQLP